MRKSKSAAVACLAAGFSLSLLMVLSDANGEPASKSPSTARAVSNTSSHGTVVRAHSIAGMAVKSPTDENLGKVEDVVIDMETGSVRYAAIAFGGFLGVGDKLFAVPFKALHVKHDSNAKTSHFILNIDKKTLEKAKGFDKKDWPDFANPRFAEENDRYFADPVSR